MQLGQLLETQEQQLVRAPGNVGLLYNPEIQRSGSGRFTWPRNPRMNPAIPKIEILKEQFFTKEGEADRIAKSLKALSQHNPIQLSAGEWDMVMGLSDVEDEFE